MIYQELAADAPLSQGDIFDGCPLLAWEKDQEAGAKPISRLARVVVLTQACDLAQSKANRVLVAAVHDAQELVNHGILKATTIRDQIRTHRVYGWYYLSRGEAIGESIIDLRDLHTIPRFMLQTLLDEGKRVTRIATPFREHLSQHFATTYTRIGLPEPYATDE